MCIGLQNIFTSKYCPLLATEIGTQAGNSEEKSSGICMAAKPTTFTVPVSLEGKPRFKQGFYSFIFSLTYLPSVSKAMIRNVSLYGSKFRYC